MQVTRRIVSRFTSKNKQVINHQVTQTLDLLINCSYSSCISVVTCIYQLLTSHPQICMSQWTSPQEQLMTWWFRNLCCLKNGKISTFLFPTVYMNKKVFLHYLGKIILRKMNKFLFFDLQCDILLEFLSRSHCWKVKILVNQLSRLWGFSR